MARNATRTPTKPAPVAQAPASPMPTAATLPAAAAPAKAATVALRGGAAVAQVALTGKAYRTAAPHNQQWWGVLQKAMVATPANGGNVVPVAPLLAGPNNPAGVPAHFVGYCLRRGYLQAMPA